MCSDVSLEKMERDFRAMKTGPFEVRPVFVRKESLTRRHVLTWMVVETETEVGRRLRVASATTERDSHGIRLPDANKKQILGAWGVWLSAK